MIGRAPRLFALGAGALLTITACSGGVGAGPGAVGGGAGSASGGGGAQGGPPPQANAASNGAAGAAGAAGQDPGSSAQSGGPPPGVGNGNVPPQAGGGTPSGVPDRSLDVVRPGKWKITSLSGVITASPSGTCSPGQLTYSPDAADATLGLTGDGRVQFDWFWLQPGASATATTAAGQAPPVLELFANPIAGSTWDQAGVTAQTPDGTLHITGTFENPSQLTGRWQYTASAVGGCSGQSHGQGSWAATPT